MSLLVGDRPHPCERLDEALPIEGRCSLLDVVAQRREQPGRVPDGASASRIDRDAVERWRGRPGDPQPARVAAHLLGERTLGHRRDRRVAGHPPGGDVEDRRAVPNRTSQDVLHRDAAQHVAGGRPRVAAARGLEAHEPAARRRNPNRARAVVAVRGRHHAARDGRPRAAGRSARRSAVIPRIPRRAPQHRFSGRMVAELRRRRLAEDHETSRTVAASQLRIGRRHLRSEGSRPLRLDRPTKRRAEILQQKRHATKRAVRQARVDLGQRPVEEPGDDGVQRGIDVLDARDRRLDELARRRIAVPNELRLRNGVEDREVRAHVSRAAASGTSARSRRRAADCGTPGSRTSPRR